MIPFHFKGNEKLMEKRFIMPQGSCDVGATCPVVKCRFLILFFNQILQNIYLDPFQCSIQKQNQPVDSKKSSAIALEFF